MCVGDRFEGPGRGGIGVPAPPGLEGPAGVGFGRGWRRWKRLLTDNCPDGPFLPVSPRRGRGSDANGREREFVFLRGIRETERAPRGVTYLGLRGAYEDETWVSEKVSLLSIFAGGILFRRIFLIANSA